MQTKEKLNQLTPAKMRELHENKEGQKGHDSECESEEVCHGELA